MQVSKLEPSCLFKGAPDLHLSPDKKFRDVSVAPLQIPI